MTPEDFIAKWRELERKERAASQPHFLDLCDVLGVPKPGDLGIPTKDYEFAVRVKKPGQEAGEVDVFKRRCFAWEYKGPRKSLVAAYRQLKDYIDALDNPPLLIVSDMREIQIHTNFTNTVKQVYRIPVNELTSVEARERLRAAFLDPEKLRPDISREKATAEAAAKIGELANELRRAGNDPRRVAHFLNKLVFCMFAEDTGLLPDNVFGELVEQSVREIGLFAGVTTDLFKAMRERDGRFGAKRIRWFNGGLFGDDDVIPLNFTQINALRDATLLDWSQIEPSIFGTLFERGLDPAKRKEMASLFDLKPNGTARHSQANLFDTGADKGVGIHYTDPDKIMKIVEPVVLRPLKAEWEAVKAEISKQREAKAKAKGAAARAKAEHAARDAYRAFRHRLGGYRVLDPACGSGNFLYLALMHLKDFDRAVENEARAMGLPADNDQVTPDAVMGIEINPYAAELAQLTIWIGEIQWQMKNAGGVNRQPILGRLAQIECRDALLNPDGSEAQWPKSDAIIGNPPFLGDKLMRGMLGGDYVEKLREAFRGRVPGGADLVCYWFEKARAMIQVGTANRAGLVATNSIRGGANRIVLDKIESMEIIYDAWSDEPWVIDGAAVRVSLISFSLLTENTDAYLDGRKVTHIFSNLTAGNADITKAKPLLENKDCAYLGIQKTGPFDIPGKLARTWLQMPENPNSQSNASVLKSFWNGIDLTRRPRDCWIIDFPLDNSQEYVALFEAPFEYAKKNIKPTRIGKREIRANERWWEHYWPRPEMRRKISNLSRYLVTPEVSKYRIFVFLSMPTLPDKNLIVITRSDDTFFGVLQSRIHELWALRTRF